MHHERIVRFDHIFRVALGAMVLAAPAAWGTGTNVWPRFRGPNGQGYAASASPPSRFGLDSNLAWAVPMPPGRSSPVLWHSHLYLTTFETGRLAVVGVDARDGRTRWAWSVTAGPVDDVHAASSPAASTPAVDASRVYAYFGSWGLVALRHDGTEAWRRPMEPPKNRYGMATSPVLHGDHVIMVLDADDLRSKIVAYRNRDGSVAWETERPGQRATWSTPAIWTPDEVSADRSERLIVFSALRLAAYDLSNGRETWSVDGFPQETVSVPVIGPNRVYAGASALGGRGNESYDAMGWKQLEFFDRDGDGKIQLPEVPDDFRMVLRPDLPKDHPGYAVPSTFKRSFKGYDLDRDGALSESEWNEGVRRWEASSRPILAAVRPDSEGGQARDRVEWRFSKGLPEMPSFYLERERERLYFVRDGGLLTCLDADTGKALFQERLGAPGQYCASPIASPGHLFLASVQGTISVVDTRTDEFRVIARNPIGQAIHATPALAGDTIYVRTEGSLMAFRRPSAGTDE